MKLKYVNTIWLEDMIQNETRLITQKKANLPKDKKQIEQHNLVFLASHYYDVAIYLYIKGNTMNVIRKNFQQAAIVYGQIVELRILGKVPLQFVSTDPKEMSWFFTPEKNPEKYRPDYAWTDGRHSLKYAFAAIVSRDQTISRYIISNIWEPEDASYLAPNSVTTTTDEHFFSYALREFILKNHEQALDFLDKVSDDDTYLTNQKNMLQAIIKINQVNFTENLHQLLDKHQKEALKKKNHKNPDWFLCLSALGLSKLALQHQIIDLADLPVDHLFFPREFLE